MIRSFDRPQSHVTQHVTLHFKSNFVVVLFHRSDIDWPPRSYDLTPSDLFFFYNTHSCKIRKIPTKAIFDHSFNSENAIYIFNYFYIYATFYLISVTSSVKSRAQSNLESNAHFSTALPARCYMYMTLLTLYKYWTYKFL